MTSAAPREQVRITQTDLDWWHDFATSREWTFAKTYATTAPHHYVVADRTPGVTHADMARAARVIQTFGQPGKYYSITNIYLTSPDGRFRWWTCDQDLAATNLVNRAPTDQLYGVQNAPSTVSGLASPFDAVASTWDEVHPVDAEQAEQMKARLAKVRGPYPPHVLDVGCGTGRVLDLGLASPSRYAGLDTSGAMLNRLVRKHPDIGALYPMDIRRALDEGLFTPGQFDWVFIDDALELTFAQRQSLQSIARRAAINVSPDCQAWTIHDVTETAQRRTLAESEAMRRESGTGTPRSDRVSA